MYTHSAAFLEILVYRKKNLLLDCFFLNKINENTVFFTSNVYKESICIFSKVSARMIISIDKKFNNIPYTANVQ